MDRVSAIAKMIDHSLLHPTMSDRDIEEGCILARALDVATACVKPYAVDRARALLKDSGVGVCAVIGFPHGNSLTEVKAYEAQKACEDGAIEIDMVVNTGKLLSGDWDYVQKDIAAVLIATRLRAALLKVIFENDFLHADQDKIRLCQICTELGTEFVKTSTGYGFVKGDDGKYSYAGATVHDVLLMRAHCGAKVQIKAAGGIRTLDEVLKFRELGVTRIGATATAAILEEAAKRFG